ncbi:hypothetical protein F1880_010328, partial [Penicillium rolfsii]
PRNISTSPFDTQNDPPLYDSYDQTGQSPLFAPTPGYGFCQTPSVMNPMSPENRLGDDFSAQDQSPQLSQIPLLQLSDWEEGRLYNEHPPTCLHYLVVWKVTFNNKTIRKNTEQGLVLAPRFHWRLFLEPKLKELIPGLRDLAVAEYSNWQQSQVDDEKLKAEFRKARDAALEDGLDLMQVHEDQDPEFFIKNGVKRGIARRFVGDIEYWVKYCKYSVEDGATALSA